MLNKIIHFSLANRLTILVAFVLLLGAGLYTTAKMEVDVLPDLNAPTVVVMTEAKGLTPTEVEQTVTFPVETAVNGATGVRRVRSNSTAGFSVVWVEFDWGMDIYRARQIVTEKLSAAEAMLPPSAGRPTLGPQGSILGELMIIGLTSDSLSLEELRTVADWTLRPRLLAIKGSASVAVIGGEVKEYQIVLDPERMRTYGVSLDEVIEATETINENVPGGVVEQYGNQYIINGVLSTTSLETLSQRVVARKNGTPLRLSEIATVQIGAKEPILGRASERGKPAVLITVAKQPQTSTLELTAEIDRTLAELTPTLPHGVHISTDIFRQSRFIETSIANIQRSLYEGAIFVVIVLFFFLMNVRTTLISLVTIPIALLVSILALKAFGLTINTMSLGGMAIAIGSLVDDAVVDVDNVLRRLVENRRLPKAERQSTITVVFEASREVRVPILNSTLIIVASFMPLFFLSGIEGRMLAPLGVAFVVALFASTIVALTLTPVLCSYLLGGEKSLAKRLDQEPWLARSLKGVYRRSLDWALGHRTVILGTTLAALVSAVAIFFTLGMNFLPPFNEGSFTINLSTMPGISLDESDRIGRTAEQLLLEIPEIQTVARKTGRAELDEHALGVNTSEIEAPFELGDRTKEELSADIRARLGSIPGVLVEVGQPISHRIDAMLSGTKANVAIKIFGDNLTQLFALGGQAAEQIKGIEGVASATVEQQVVRPEVQLIPNTNVLARYGITLPEFGRQVDVLLAGRPVSNVREGNRRFDVTLKTGKARWRSSLDDLKQIPLVSADGVSVPLGAVAEVRSTSSANSIGRENGARRIVVSVAVEGRDISSTVDEIQATLSAGLPLDEGYRIEYGGQFESARSANRTLAFTSLFALLVVFMLLYGEFRSVPQALVILTNLPLAIIGGVWVLFLTGDALSIPSIIGFISLFGIAVRNGMLLISRYNDLRAGGLSLVESVRIGSLDRLNPILMTALTSALALVPLAMGGGVSGSEIQAPMAVVILGGLFSSTLLNAFVVPIMYLWIERKKQ